MNTMIQIYTAKTKERAEKLNNDICETFVGSKYFVDNQLIVTPVEPFYDINDSEKIAAYGFWVYFDTVELDSDVQVQIQIDRFDVDHGKLKD